MALTKITGQVINTATDVTVGVLTVTNTLSVGGTVSVGGTLTYEDVTNVDSVGIITARSNILVGSGITLSPDGDVFTTGVSTFSDKIIVTGESEQDIIHVSTGNTTPYANIRGDNEGGIRIRGGGSSNGGTIELAGGLRDTDPGIIKFSTGESGSSNERLRIDLNGKLLINSTAVRHLGGVASSGQIQVEGTGGNNSSIQLIRNSNSSGPSFIRFGKTRGTGVGTTITVANGDHLGAITFNPSDGTDLFNTTAKIVSVVNGTVAEDQIPTDLAFETSINSGANRAERLRIMSTGRVLIGDDTARLFDGGNTPLLQVSDNTSGRWARIASATYIDTTIGGGIILAHSRNGTVGSHTILQDDDKLGSVFFEGSDGTQFARGAQIQAYVDGPVGINSMPGRIEFGTTVLGASSPTTNLVIDSSGRLIAAAGRVTPRTHFKDINGDTSTPSFQFETANDDSAHSLSLTFGRNNTHGPELKLAKHRSATIGGRDIVQTGDELGCLSFLGSDGTNFIPAAAIRGLVDVGTPGTDDMPGAIRFATTADGASTTTDQMELTRNGTLDFLVASNGIKFSNGHSVTPNDATPVNQIFDDYEEGELDWEIHKSDYLTTGSNTTSSRVTYQKIGSMVHIQGWIRTDGTAPAGTGGKVAILTDASGNRAQLPFTPLGNVAIPITFTRSFNNTTTASSLCLGASHAADDVYVHMNQSNNYTPASDNCTLTTQTNLVIAFNGHYHTTD